MGGLIGIKPIRAEASDGDTGAIVGDVAGDRKAATAGGIGLARSAPFATFDAVGEDGCGSEVLGLGASCDSAFTSSGIVLTGSSKEDIAANPDLLKNAEPPPIDGRLETLEDPRLDKDTCT